MIQVDELAHPVCDADRIERLYELVRRVDLDNFLRDTLCSVENSIEP